MSQRYEWGGPTADLEVVPPGTVLGYGMVGEGCYALVIGNPWDAAYAIEGSLEGLREFAQRVTDVVEQIQPVQAVSPTDSESQS